MLSFATRRLILAIPTLIFISFIVFMLLQLAPGDPMAQVPLTVPPEVKEKMRQALGLGEPPLVLATSVFFALKQAIRASRVERGLDPLFNLDAPATVQEVRRACELDLGASC